MIFSGTKKKFFWKKYKLLKYLNKNIKILRFKKKNNVILYFPTYNDFNNTKKTIDKLQRQTFNNFDILILDNGGDDTKHLLSLDKEINLIKIFNNVGSTGAQWIGLHFCLKQNYRYLIISDNDSLLIENDGIEKLINNLINSGGSAIVPNNLIKLFQKNDLSKIHLNNIEKCNSFQISQYFLIDVHKVDLKNSFNPIMFLSCEDVMLSSRVLGKDNILYDNSVNYYHKPIKPYHLSSKAQYLKLRGLFLIIFFEKKIKPLIKIRIIGFLFFSIIELIINSIRFYDLNPIKIIYRSFLSSLSSWTFDEIKIEINNLENFKYNLNLIEPKNNINNFKLLKDKDKFILPKRFKVFDSIKKKYTYFELKRI